MNNNARAAAILTGLALVFLMVAAFFLLDLWGHPASLAPIPLVDPAFTNTATVRESAAELIRTGGDTSGQQCYTCHDPKKQSKLTFDDKQNIVLPKEHDDIVMGHGQHHRNNNCFNCHDETNLELLQTRDGRQLKIEESTPLCGSCHGPTYRDWERGVHGRTSGFWQRTAGPVKREDCVSCHNPHSPRFPSRAPAPAPHPLRPVSKPANPPHEGH